MAKRKRLVHIISSLRQGGAETLLAGLVGHMQEFEHHVFYLYDGPIRHELILQGVETYAIKGMLRPYDFVALYRLCKAIKKINPCCIHTSLWAANILGYLVRFFTKIPVVSATHALVEHEGKARTLIERCLPLEPSRYIAVSPQIADSLINRRFISPSLITTIHNGIDTKVLSAYQNTSIKKKDVFIFGSVGRFVKVKNYALLLESFAQIAKQQNDIKLILIGSGPEEQSLRQQARSLEIAHQVTFVVGQNALPYYAQFDCFVQPSRYEGLSLALLEALFFELPVIVTSPTSPHHDLIQTDHNGLVIPADNKQALTQALTLMLSDTLLRKRLSRQARSTIGDTFTIEQTAKKYGEVIHSLSSY